MKLQLEIGDRLRTVEVERGPQGYRVTVDGRRHLVQSTRIDGSTWSLLVSDQNGHASRSVEAGIVAQAHNGGVDVHIDGYRIPVSLRNGRPKRKGDARRSERAASQRIVAPMPGKVVRVLVKPGDEVKTRQVLVVVEAMKMENELRAAHDGKVASVFVSPGQSVEAGAPLIALE